MTTKRKKPAKPSTALARRKSHTPPSRMLAKARRAELVAAPPADVSRQSGSDLNVLGEETALGALGLVEIRLTKAEEKVLAEPVRVDDVEIKPNGRPFLSHPGYTRWFNRAFGRLGWNLVPRAKPMRSGNSVVCPYVLYIHGKPAAMAFGEQEYFDDNKDQTYGDALEATVASALRRCAKRLGVGLELWDRPWLNHFMATRCVKVMTTSKEKNPYKWRRTIDPPFWNEVGNRGGDSVQQQRQDRRQAPGHHDGNSEQPITAPQRKRLFAILRSSGRDEATFRAWLKGHYQLDSTKGIKQKDYDAVCAAIEAPAPMFSTPPRQVDDESNMHEGPHEREPGEEG